MASLLANFSCLDELTQVIYQGIYKFVLLSTVTDDHWTVHVGLSGREGRWWKGSWNEEDIQHILGHESTDRQLESFAESLAEALIGGNSCVSDWSSERGAKIKFTLRPTSAKPIHLPLTELAPEAAASYATSIFIQIALQAQSRKCRLYPSTANIETTYTPLEPLPSRGRELSGPSTIKESKTTTPLPPPSTAANHKIDKSAPRKNEDKTVDTKRPKAQAEPKSSTPAPTAAGSKSRTAGRPPQGTSLANPNKKARKVKAMEFASDEED